MIKTILVLLLVYHMRLLLPLWQGPGTGTIQGKAISGEWWDPGETHLAAHKPR